MKQEKKEDGNNKTKLITQNVTVSSINNIILNFLICRNSYTIKPKREQWINWRFRNLTTKQKLSSKSTRITTLVNSTLGVWIRKSTFTSVRLLHHGDIQIQEYSLAVYVFHFLTYPSINIFGSENYCFIFILSANQKTG